MDNKLEEMLAQKRNQAIAIIMSVKEEEVDSYLPDDASYSLRKVVLDQINAFHNLAHSLLKSTADSVELNQYYLDLISEMHDVVTKDRD